MILTISGLSGSGKSTLAKNLAKELGLKHYSAGGLLREISEKRGLTLMQLHDLMEKDKSIDLELDKKTAELGKKEDNFVIDGRVAWHFIPNSVKIFVKIDLRTAAERIFEDIKKGKEERQHEQEHKSLEQTMEKMKQRNEMNGRRYEKLYGINYLDEKNYDLVLDTTKASREETLERALEKIREIAGSNEKTS